MSNRRTESTALIVDRIRIIIRQQVIPQSVDGMTATIIAIKIHDAMLSTLIELSDGGMRTDFEGLVLVTAKRIIDELPSMKSWTSTINPPPVH